MQVADDVRARAVGGARNVEWWLRHQGVNLSAAGVRDDLVEQARPPGGAELLGSSLGRDGAVSVTWYYELAESRGGGWLNTQVGARICVRLEIPPASPRAVHLEDASCDGAPPLPADWAEVHLTDR